MDNKKKKIQNNTANGMTTNGRIETRHFLFKMSEYLAQPSRFNFLKNKKIEENDNIQQ